jgi:hypothetical protein
MSLLPKTTDSASQTACSEARAGVHVQPPHALHASGEAGETTLFGVVKMNVLNSLVKEKLFDTGADVGALAHISGDHHMCRIVRAGRDETTTHVVGDLTDLENALLGASAHVDRP